MVTYEAAHRAPRLTDRQTLHRREKTASHDQRGWCARVVWCGVVLAGWCRADLQDSRCSHCLPLYRYLSLTITMTWISNDPSVCLADGLTD
mmetsp:Transcript_48368/g.121087  ORF Transcript_48368/g.121087 Transcript_48368/m.121087 type:complete len:91 (+) Transcript_48368:1821-2093(+)